MYELVNRNRCMGDTGADEFTVKIEIDRLARRSGLHGITDGITRLSGWESRSEINCCITEH